MNEELVVIYHAGTVTPLLRSTKHSLSIFGGPLKRQVTGETLAKPLHRIATLSFGDLALIGLPNHVRTLPLMYGMFYDSGFLRYSFKDVGNIEVARGLLGEPTPDWPYRNYPELLPCVPLEAGMQMQESWSEFCRRAPNLPDAQPSELVALVPPPATIGFSMWGPSGDAEGVTLVFECDLASQSVATYNVCG